MNRPQARTSDILGHQVPCMFSKAGNGDHPFRYEPCRSCNGLDTICPAYIPSHNSQQVNNSKQSLQGLFCSKPADTYIPMMVRKARYTKILPRNYQDWIRRLNDGGVI